MRIAITGATGFVGRHLARALAARGHELLLISRGLDRRDPEIRSLAGACFMPIGTGDEALLTRAFAGCHAVAHCAGINRETGDQTYQSVHVEGTRHVVQAARRAGVPKIVLLSFLRARPHCGSGYHESKWQAEEIVRSSNLDFTVVKAGLIYGRVDHTLDHLSLAVGKDHPVRPTAVEDVVRVLEAALVEGRLSRQTVAVLGPEAMPLGNVVRPPVACHNLLARLWERVMPIAQGRLLAEGITEPLPAGAGLPDDAGPGLPDRPPERCPV